MLRLDEIHDADTLRQVAVLLERENRSRRGTEVAALFYSLIVSAKLSGVDPKRYLLTATRAALADRAAVTLPHTLLA